MRKYVHLVLFNSRVQTTHYVIVLPNNSRTRPTTGTTKPSRWWKVQVKGTRDATAPVLPRPQEPLEPEPEQELMCPARREKWPAIATAMRTPEATGWEAEEVVVVVATDLPAPRRKRLQPGRTRPATPRRAITTRMVAATTRRASRPPTARRQRRAATAVWRTTTAWTRMTDSCSTAEALPETVVESSPDRTAPSYHPSRQVQQHPLLERPRRARLCPTMRPRWPPLRPTEFKERHLLPPPVGRILRLPPLTRPNRHL